MWPALLCGSECLPVKKSETDYVGGGNAHALVYGGGGVLE